jgi:hypothetical protein
MQQNEFPIQTTKRPSQKHGVAIAFILWDPAILTARNAMSRVDA